MYCQDHQWNFSSTLPLPQSWGTMHRKQNGRPRVAGVVSQGAYLFGTHWGWLRPCEYAPIQAAWEGTSIQAAWAGPTFPMSNEPVGAGRWPQGHTLRNKDLGNTKTE